MGSRGSAGRPSATGVRWPARRGPARPDCRVPDRDRRPGATVSPCKTRASSRFLPRPVYPTPGLVAKRIAVTLPLEGIRVIEVGQALAGPLAGVLLADMGADVIKIEKPERLCETADILIQNLRPGVVDEIGIGPEAMLARHPRLIYCSIWAFGYAGPLKMKPGFDPLLQAYGGMMMCTGRADDPPTFCGASINDKATGMFCTIGALAALRLRDKTGKGCVVDTSLFDSAVHWVEGQVNNYLASGEVPRRHGTGGAVIVPYQLFDTADRPLCLAPGNDRLWARCAEVLGHPEWATDPRYARSANRVKNKVELIPMIAAVMRTRSRADWLAMLDRAGVPCSPVNDIGELVATEQFEAAELVRALPEGQPKVVGLPISF